MTFTVVNLFLLAAAGGAYFLEGKPLKLPFARFLPLVALVVFGAAISAAEPFSKSLIWPAMAVSAAVFFHETVAREPERRINISLAGFMGFAPVLFADVSSPAGLIMYLLLFESFKYFAALPSKNSKGGQTALGRIEAKDMSKVFCALLVFLFAAGSLEGFSYEKTRYIAGGAGEGLAISLAILGLLYAGFFDGFKDDKREALALERKNPVLYGAFYRGFLPAVIFLHLDAVLRITLFDRFQLLQAALLFLFALLLVSEALKIFAVKSRFSFFRIYFLGLAALLIFRENFASYEFLASSTGIYTILLLSALPPFNKKLGWAVKAGRFLTLPSPFSPPFWAVLWGAWTYQGPMRGSLAGFVFFAMLLGLFCFNWNKLDLLDTTVPKSKIKPSGPISLTILAAFLSILFIVKISP